MQRSATAITIGVTVVAAGVPAIVSAGTAADTVPAAAAAEEQDDDQDDPQAAAVVTVVPH